MTNSKTTKKALLSSALALTMCVAMLIATTFAWFTDTASTAVNKIQSGTLDVALEMATAWDTEGNPTTWESAEGKTLEFKKAAGAAEGEAVLWEPGCTYELPELRVVNKGNLALKYKVLITGIEGDAKLNEAIEWTISDTALDSDHSLAANATSETLTIKGHMKEEAGNDYQNLTIDGISITVVATQDTVESDSYDKIYDEYAEYPVVAVTQVAVDDQKKTTAATTIKSVKTVSQENTTSLATATIPAGVKTTAADGDTDTQLKLTVNDAAVPANFTANVTVNDSDVVKTLEVKMTGLATDNETPIKVEMYVGSGMDEFKLYHNNNLMTSVASADAVDEDQEYFYDKTSGMVTMNTATFSPFTYVYDASIKVASMEDLSVASSATWARIVKPGYYKLTEDITISKILCFNADGIDIDLNNHTLTIDGKEFRTNADVVDAKFHNGKIVIKGSGNLWSPSWGTTNLTFDDVDVTSTSRATIFWARGYQKESTLNIVGNDFNIENSRFLWACPDNGSEANPSKVNVTASGVNVKQTNYTYLEAVMLQTQYNYGQVVANFENCSFDTSTRDSEPVKISSYATKSGNSISLTMDGCSLIAKSPEDLSDYISGYSAENVTLTLNNCTGNDNVALTK